MADLHHLGRREGRLRAAALLERFDLVDAARKLPGTYSGGMRRRLDLAMTLVDDPRIIFLDEPTTGLDPRSRHTMWQIIRLQFTDAHGLEAAARILGEVSRDDDALTLQVPSDGNVRSIKALLDRLDDEGIVVNDLSIHTPDLDDVFFALTDHSPIQKGNVQ
jgi:ABC-2 type transport system ATP-binding protein